ncbi:hypothetical protein A5740_24450 [Mycobacterium sp. GA-1841]|uniref:hypothetical protein n=1 Tax=Mycobacterium sp. GA-1841 TaxID=1834154 RepID=UPI00096FCAE9|nr:hypothetical protein [Mycobacterium sp. GA-1841]OMC40170.1 hypothetical protein A5740_24450 [Mycobacterium sp. GA-1841]
MLEMLCWLLLPPSAFKNRVLRSFGHAVAATARIGPTLVLNVDRFEVGEGVRFGLFNVVRGLSLVRFEEHAAMESWNWISAHPSYQQIDAKAGTLFVGYGAKLGSRHYADCSGTIVLREYAAVGGNRCLLQTHEPDFVHKRQTVGRVTVGHHSLVGSGAVMLKDSQLPDQSVLAANSTMTQRSAPEPKRGLYAGSPATWKRETPGAYFERDSLSMTEHVIDSPMGVLSEDLATGRYRVRPG